MYVQFWILLLLQRIIFLNALPRNDNLNAEVPVRDVYHGLAIREPLEFTDLQERDLELSSSLANLVQKRARETIDPNDYEDHMQIGHSSVWVAVNYAGTPMAEWLFTLAINGLQRKLFSIIQAFGGDRDRRVPGGALSLTFPLLVPFRGVSLDFNFILENIPSTQLTFKDALNLLNHLRQYAFVMGDHDLLSEIVFYRIRNGVCYKWLTGSFSETTRSIGGGRKLLGAGNSTSIDLLTLSPNEVVAANATSPKLRYGR